MSETLRIDTDRIPDAALARWAKARIAADGRELGEQLAANDRLRDGRFDAGLHFDSGLIMVRDQDGNVFVPGPIGSVIGMPGETNGYPTGGPKGGAFATMIHGATGGQMIGVLAYSQETELRD